MKDWIQHFPQLNDLADNEKIPLLDHVSLVELPAAKVVYHVGDNCHHFLLVLSGSVRVQMYSQSGHEIVLYRVEGGGSCILTTSCLLANEAYQAEAITETAVQAVLIPAQVFDQAMAQSAAFRQFVFTGYARRVSDLLYLINAIAFERMDARLAHLLVQRMDDQQVLHITHQDIANELGTAREVVSRLLKELERRRIITLQRACLTIVDLSQLRAISNG